MRPSHPHPETQVLSGLTTFTRTILPRPGLYFYQTCYHFASISLDVLQRNITQMHRNVKEYHANELECQAAGVVIENKLMLHSLSLSATSFE